MIKLKLSFGNDKPEQTFPFVSEETLDKTIARALSEVPLEDKDPAEIFNVVVNGHLIEKDFWPLTSIGPETNVLITPRMTSGEGGQIFKQVLIIAITVVATYFAGPAGLQLGAAASAAFAAGVTIAASLLLNALIPPPVANTPGFGGSYEESQMYAISGQSNQSRRFGTVPKVYGSHRIFPNVAANPYTELENDSTTGELVQYLYAVYDFGFGPMDVRDIRIGDTPLVEGNFSDFAFRLVDFNKPEISEGPWDDNLESTLSFYKGDSEPTVLGVALNGNQNDGAPQQEWEAIRNSSPNTDGSSQEIILQFVNPLGLYGFAANGARDFRQVDLDISFSKVDEDVWRKYNDSNYVSNFNSAGGDTTQHEVVTTLLPAPDAYGDAYYLVARDYEEYFYIKGTAWYAPDVQTMIPGPSNNPAPYPSLYVRYHEVVPRPGQNKLIIKHVTGLVVGASVQRGSGFAGVVTLIEAYGPNSDYRIVTLDRPLVGYWSDVTYFIGKRDSSFFKPMTSAFGAGTYKQPDQIRILTNTLGSARIKRNDTAPVYSTFKFTPKEPAQYKVRIRRLTAYSPFVSNVSDDLTWASLTTRFDRSPIVTDKRHTFLELKIRATSQLNGNVANLSAICTSALEVYDANTETWTRQLTSNPAWVFTDLLIGEVNKKPVDKSRVHLPSILEWEEYCDEVPDGSDDFNFEDPRFTTNFVLDYQATLQEVLNQVSGAGQASLNIVDGKYGVLIDRFQDTPVQIFTPRNSREFSSVRNYGPRPHGLKVKFIDPNLNWEAAEAIAYDNGFNKDNAEDIEEMTSFACTSSEQAWRFGRYMIAQNRFRQETISILVDFEHLVCTRGDYVQITQDVMRVGGTPARVKAISGNVVTINDALETDPMLNYGYAYRGADGIIANSTLTMLTPRTAELDGDLPAVGDLIVIGETGRVVFDCIVKSISPNDDMSANIILVEKADEIYAYENTDLLPEYDPQISQTGNPDFKPPGPVQNLVVTDVSFDCAQNGSGYDNYVELTWDAPVGSVYEYFSVYVSSGLGFEEVAQSRSTVYRYIVPAARLGQEHKFKVVAVSATGKKLLLAGLLEVTATPVLKTTPPSDVEKLNTDITNEVLQLSWTAIDDCDAQRYLLRFSPSTGATWETSLPLLAVDAKTTSASFQARTGTYLIKAMDFAGNVSDNAISAITTIPNLFNLNIIAEIDDTPDFLGGYDRVIKDGSALTLDNSSPGVFYSEGYYYFESLLDLGQIYSVRLQSAIQAEGLTDEDLMVNWVTLDSVLLLANSKFAEWDVETQYRSTESFNVIAEWDTLDEVMALNGGADDIFTEWRTFTIGDATGRVFQFRLRLLSYKPTVSPRVFSGLIKADMPDRFESYENLVVDSVDGYEVEYNPAFKGPGLSPNVQVSIESAESGDYWAFDYKTLDGFLIRVYDKNDVQVERQVDVHVKGFGRKATSII